MSTHTLNQIAGGSSSESNAWEVIVDGDVVGEVYEMEGGLGWGYVNYETDLGADIIDSRDEAVQALLEDL